jgi:hypothetical protein
MDYPEPEVCSAPVALATDQVELRDRDTREPFIDGDHLPLGVDEVDGHDVALVRVTVDGAGASACLAQSIEIVRQGGSILAAERRPIVFHPIAGELEADLALPLSGTPDTDEPVLVRATAGGQTTLRRLVASPGTTCAGLFAGEAWQSATASVDGGVRETWPGVPELAITVRAAGGPVPGETWTSCLGDAPIVVRDAEGFELGRARLPVPRRLRSGDVEGRAVVLLARRPHAGETLHIDVPVTGAPLEVEHPVADAGTP